MPLRDACCEPIKSLQLRETHELSPFNGATYRLTMRNEKGANVQLLAPTRTTQNGTTVASITRALDAAQRVASEAPWDVVVRDGYAV
jgi:hypothetical protein